MGTIVNSVYKELLFDLYLKKFGVCFSTNKSKFL